jgi:hypothetical protein
MRAHHLLVVFAALGACKKAKEAPPSPSAPTSSAEQDALWALAPEGVIFGFVASPAGLAKLDAGMADVHAAMSAAPELAPFKAKMEEEIGEVLGTGTLSLAAAGLTSKKGFALFVVPDKAPIVILPIGDRDKFLSVAKGQKGNDSDTIKRATCKTVKNVYACTRDVELFDLLGKGKLNAPLALAGARGDIEAAGALPSPPVTFGAVAQLSRGAAVVRGGVKGLPPQVKQMLANVKPRVDGDKTAGFAVANITPILEQVRDKVPPMPLIAGVNADELVKTITGPITVTVPNASLTFDLRLPLTDGSVAKKLVEQCDKFPGAAMVGAKVEQGVCSATVPQVNMTLEAWVDGNTFRLGQRNAPAGPASPLSPVAQELANGEWVLAMFGRGTLFAPIQLPMPMPAAQMPPEAFLGIRTMAMVNELGLGFRVDGDVVRYLGSIRTAWSNPDDVVAKILAITPQQIAEGKAGAAAKAIVDAHPKSPFAADHATGYAGLMIPAAVIGVVAGVAIPAFMDYMKKSKRTEASLQLNKLAKNLKVAHVTDGAFPKGKVGPTPAKSCCEQGGKCAPDPAAWSDPVWQALDFTIDEPHLFRYSYESDGKTAVVTAHGDLDCDGQEIQWVTTGNIGPDGNPSFTMVAPAPNTD